MSEATAGNAVGEAVRAGVAAGPLFLVGVPRSGTTLLYKLLCLHPDAAYISNWMRTAPAVPALALANRLTPCFADTRRTTWFGADRANAYVNGEPMAWRKQLFPRPVEGEPFYRSCGIAVPDSAGRPDMGRLQRLPGMLGAVCRYGGGRVFVSKYLANNHHIPALAELFPSARFVSIVRDGRAVACSLSRVHWWPDLTVWWYGGTPGRWQAEGRDPWELCARHWVRELAVLEQGWRPSPRRGGSRSATRRWSPIPWPRCDSSPHSLAWLTAGTGYRNWPGCGTRTGTSAGTRGSTRRFVAASRPSRATTSAGSATSADRTSLWATRRPCWDHLIMVKSDPHVIEQGTLQTTQRRHSNSTVAGRLGDNAFFLCGFRRSPS